MRVAATLVYHQLNRRLGGTEEGASADFESAALALSHLADIYHADAAGRIAKVPRAELSLAEFADGGDTCRTPAGRRYTSLTLRRADLMDAIVILGNVRAARGD